MAMPDDLSNIDTALSNVVVPVGYPAIARRYQSPSEKEVTTAELPCYLILWGTQKPKTQIFTFGTTLETRLYIVRFIYKPTGQGTLTDNLREVAQYRQPTLTALYAHIRLYSTVMAQTPIQCGYPLEFPEEWNGQKHVGMDIVITVKEQRTTVFGA
jgi:hypothetical protein